jgi:hypothetical protein
MTPERYDHRILLARSHAFHFNAPPPPDIRSDRFLRSARSEDVTHAVLANAMEGDFRHFSRLIDLMKSSDDGVLWQECSLLLSHAAPYSSLHDVLDAFSEELHGDDVVTQQWISEILCRSGALWSVPEVLRLWRLNQQLETYDAIPALLSLMLEEQRAEIAKGPPVLPRTDGMPDWLGLPASYDDEKFDELVLSRHAKLWNASADPAQVAVWEGAPLSLPRVAERALALIEDGEDVEEIAIARTQLEAATGEDLSDFYDDGLLRNLSAAAHVEALVESGILRRFAAGRRHFFGQVIPG